MSTFCWTSLLLLWHDLRGQRPRALPSPPPGGTTTAAAEEDRPMGCGWFDSSHDLQHGLQIREADGQALALLPLKDWLTLQVAPCNAADTQDDAARGMIAALTLL